jgi:hypothetical protein
MSDSDYRYLHPIRQDCPLPPGTHVVGLSAKPETCPTRTIEFSDAALRE